MSSIGLEWFMNGQLVRTTPMSGVEVTELADGGYYFAPPGDFSKVDFSACQKKEIDPWVMAGIKAGASMQAFSGWAITGFLDPNLKKIDGLDQARARVVASGAPSLDELCKRFAGWDAPEVSGTLPSKADTKPKTAQQQAKPALPSLMTEAGERYQGLGWCDE